MSFLRHYGAILQASRQGSICLLYLPLQTASQRLLKLMNRPPDIEGICAKVQAIRESHDLVFYTNWMVGFPTEEADDYEQSVALAKELRLEVNVVIPYSDRPGTSAASLLPKVPVETKRARTEHFREDMAAMKADMLIEKCCPLPPHVEEKLVASIVSAELASADDLFD